MEDRDGDERRCEMRRVIALSFVAECLHRIHPRCSERRQESRREGDHRQHGRRATITTGSYPLSSYSSDCAARPSRDRGGDPDDAADQRHHAHLAQARARARSPRPRRAPCARRSRACAAPPSRRARRTGRSPRAASPGARTPRVSVLIMRSRNTFSRTCCGSVLERFERQIRVDRLHRRPDGANALVRGQRRSHVERVLARRVRLLQRKEEHRRNLVLHLRVLRILGQSRRSRCSASRCTPTCACPRRCARD